MTEILFEEECYPIIGTCFNVFNAFSFVPFRVFRGCDMMVLFLCRDIREDW
jgi:hypothetical protein